MRCFIITIYKRKGKGKMPKRTLKKVKETKEENKMLKNKKRNNTSSTSSYNSCTFDISRDKYKLSSKQ